MEAISATTIPKSIADALTTASERTGTGFDYLLRTAVRESGLNPGAKAPTSSATGLFQFIEQTWFETLKEAGPRNGLAAFADDINRTPSGRYEVADPQARQEILALRNDPVVASLMAGELTASNREEIGASLGREPTQGELYIGHFLGAGGAARLISAAQSEPDTPAADLFPSAASANRSIFYERDGTKRGADEVYARLVRQHDEGARIPFDTDRRETATPFAGIIAFFESLFSSGGGREAAKPAPLAFASSGPRFEQSAFTLFSPDDEPEISGPEADASIALAGRIAVGTYAAHASVGAPPEPRSGNTGAVTPIEIEPWSGGLFTNADRASGPLSFTSDNP